MWNQGKEENTHERRVKLRAIIAPLFTTVDLPRAVCRGLWAKPGERNTARGDEKHQSQTNTHKESQALSVLIVFQKDPPFKYPLYEKQHLWCGTFLYQPLLFSLPSSEKQIRISVRVALLLNRLKHRGSWGREETHFAYRSWLL